MSEVNAALHGAMDDLYDHLYFEGSCAKLMNDYYFSEHIVVDKERILETLLPLCKLLNKLFFTHGPIDS